MLRQLTPERRAEIECAEHPTTAPGLVVAAAAARGAAVAASGLILAVGLALVLWALTPASGADVVGALRGGVVAFAAANLMPVLIGGVRFSLPPLLLTLAIAALLASAARRGRFLPQGRYQETVSVLVTAAVYGLVVATTTRGFGPPEAVPAGGVWIPPALALLATAGGALRRGAAWRDWWTLTVPDWVRPGLRGGGIGFGVLIGGGGLALSVGLISHFGSAVEVAAIAAPSLIDGLGLAVLGLVYLPNAVIVGAGYISGVGFDIGPGTYSPFATTTTDLPAVPLLAAAPDQSGRSWIGLAFLVLPAIAGCLISRPAIKHLATRGERVLSAAMGAGLTGALLAVTAAIARGGVGDGRWSAIGVSPVVVGAVVAVEVGAVAVAVTALAGGRSVPWRSQNPGRAAGSAKVTALAEDQAPADADLADADADADAADNVRFDADSADADLADDVRVEDPPTDDPADDESSSDERDIDAADSPPTVEGATVEASECASEDNRPSADEAPDEASDDQLPPSS